MSESRTLVVAIDGPAGVGKSSVSRRLADDLGWAYLDTGAMYRLVTLAAVLLDLPLQDEDVLAETARTLEATFETDGTVRLRGQDVTSRLRGPRVTAGVSVVAAWPAVRREVVAWQRGFAKEASRVVAEGRDTGSVVFPDAAVKVFLDGDAGERARRRLLQEEGALDPQNLASTKAKIEDRDRRDRSRKVSPLVQAEDAWRLDTSSMTLDGVFEAVRAHVRSRVPIASSDESRA